MNGKDICLINCATAHILTKVNVSSILDRAYLIEGNNNNFLVHLNIYIYYF